MPTLSKTEIEPLAAALNQLERKVEANDIADLVIALIAFAAAFEIPAKVEEVDQFYRIGLKDMPRFLLPLAYERLIKTWKWGNRLPMPADFFDIVSPEIHKLSDRRFYLTLASS